MKAEFPKELTAEVCIYGVFRLFLANNCDVFYAQLYIPALSEHNTVHTNLL